LGVTRSSSCSTATLAIKASISPMIWPAPQPR
jgi:hypothetical protein